jgi:uncharacterized protein
VKRGIPEPARGDPGVDLAFFMAFFVVWAVCAKVFWFSTVNGALLAELGRTGTGLLLCAINVAVWLGFAFAYLRATGRDRPLAYLKLKGNVTRGFAVGILAGLAFVAKDLARVLLLEGRAPDLAGLTPSSFLSPFVEEVVFRGLVLQRAGEYTGFWKANALSSALFVAVHLPGWTFAGTSLAGILSSATFVFLLSLLLGYLLRKTGSLWASVVCHTMSNWGATF